METPRDESTDVSGNGPLHGKHTPGRSVDLDDVVAGGNRSFGARGRINRRRFLAFGAAASGAGLAANTMLNPGAAAAAAAVRARSRLAQNPIEESAAWRRIAEAVTTATTTGSGGSADLVVAPLPTGVAATDTANLLKALDVPAGTTVVLRAKPTAVYVVSQELPVPPGVRVTGYGAPNEQPQFGLMATLQQAAGTNLKCLLGSAAYLAGLYSTSQYNNGAPKTTADSAIEIDHLAFDGQNAANRNGVTPNTVGHAVVLMSVGSKLHDCYFINVAQAAMVVSDANYAGTPCQDATVDNRIYDNKVMDCGWQGIWVTKTNGAPGSTDGYMLNNVVESPSLQTNLTNPNINPSTGVPYEAIRMDNAAAWWVENNHAYACPGNGMYFATPWGMHLVNNSTDSFGANPVPGTTYIGYEIVIEGAADQTRPIIVSTNQLSAYEGYNTASIVAPGSSNTYKYYVVSMDQASWGNTAWLVQSNNSCHQDSQIPPPISPATLKAGSTTVSVPNGSTTYTIDGHGVQAGMSITDSEGLVPAGATIVSVVPGVGGAPDTITLSVAATGSSSNDTVSFVGPTSIGWTYDNQLAGSTLLVNRTNEIVSGTIGTQPQLTGSGSVTIVDPAELAGVGSAGPVSVTGTPQVNQVLVATSSTSATWANLQATGSGAPTVDVITSSQSYSIPAGANQLRVTCVGGGGGGGGGGAAGTGAAQAGGSGGAAGTTSRQIVLVGDNTSLNVIVGAGGSGGAGGASGGANSGGNGAAGGDTTVTGTGIAVQGTGGPGGKGAAGGSTASVNGAAYGGQQGDFVAGTTAGCGGSSQSAGGSPGEMSPGGGGGGGPSNTTTGGGGGGAGSATNGGAAGSKASASGGSGQAGQSASAPGAGGGGGGGGTTTSGAGGAGGAGAPGFVVIETIP